MYLCKYGLKFLAALLMFQAAAYAVPAGVPQEINYQGYYRESGRPVTGNRTMKFRVTNLDGLTEYWSSADMTVAVSTGLFNVAITPAGVDWGTAAPYIEVTVAGELLGREKIASSIYALHAATAAYAESISGINSAAITGMGNIFNGNSQLVKLESNGYLPALNGSNLTGVQATGIADNAVTAGKIAAGAVTDAKVTLSAAAITSGKFGDDRVAITAAAVSSLGALATRSVVTQAEISGTISSQTISGLGVLAARNSIDESFITGAITASKLTGALPALDGSALLGISSIAAGAYENVRVGTAALAYSLKLADGSQGQGKVLTSDAAGLASWGSVSAGAFGDISLAKDANRTISVQQETANSSGKDLTIKSGSGAVGGAAVYGGSLYLQAGHGYNLNQVERGGDLHLRSGGNLGNAGPGFANGGAIILETGGASSTFIERMRITETGNVGINSATPTSTFTVVGTFKLVDGTQGANKVLTSDTNGRASWAAVSAGNVVLASTQIFTGLNTFTNGILISSGIWSAGGSQRGINSVDLQTKRSNTSFIASGDYSVLGGGQNNTASDQGATVSGGMQNTASGFVSTVSGGSTNNASNIYATVSGGGFNTASNAYATVSGGASNNASSAFDTVSGGQNNTASGSYSTVSGGHNNTVSGSNSTVSGGAFNNVSGQSSTVAGGYTNTAKGDYSFAAGRQSSSTVAGAFTWADSEGTDVTNDVADRTWFKNRGGFLISRTATASAAAFAVDSTNNVGIWTITPKATLDINGFMRLKRNSSEPLACDAAHDGAVALTNTIKWKICVCDGPATAWKFISDGTACAGNW